MTDKEKKNKIADVLLDFYDEYDSNVINRPMIPNIYAGKILDSLQKEPASKVWHDVSEEPKPNMELICVGQYGNPLVLSSNSNSFKKRYISKWAYFNDLLNLSNIQRTVKYRKEPVTEDLEGAVDAYLATYFGSEKEKQEWPFLKKMAIHFAEWQHQKDSIPVSEELKEIAWNYADKRCHLDVAVFTPDEVKKERGKTQFTWQDLYDAVMLGAKWKKEQMMADAISAKVTEIYYPTDSCLEIEATLPESRFKDGDKVLIIKKD